jgi:tRNA modification GTPase
MNATVSLLTPPGVAAIAVLEVMGADAWRIARQAFRPASGAALPDVPIANGVWFGRVGPLPGDEAILTFPANRDWPTVEVHCHGGRQVTRTLIDCFVSLGCVEQIAKPASTPLALLPRAPTLRTASILLDQVHGAFGRALARAKSDPALAERLRALAPVGARLVEPWKVAIGGAPNAGKSSLLNALAGFQRSIVTPIPGTTRDVVTASLAFDGWPVDLADTAGIRDADDDIERAGIDLALEQIAQADLSIWLVDATNPVDPPSVFRDRAKRWLAVVNKIDRIQNAAEGVSAATGAGLEGLIKTILAILIPIVPVPGEGVPYSAECVAALNRNVSGEQ